NLPSLREARAPNQAIGLSAVADNQGHPRAALDANDLRIRCLGPQHPVESYRQLTRVRYLGHALRLAVAAMQIRPPQTPVKRTALCGDGSATAVCAAARGSASIAAETAPPTAVSECALRPACRSSVCTHSWPG